MGIGPGRAVASSVIFLRCGRIKQVASPFQIEERAGTKADVVPLHGAPETHGCVFPMTAEKCEQRRLIFASRFSEKTEICAAVNEEKDGGVFMWKRLMCVMYKDQVVKGLRLSILLLHDVNMQKSVCKVQTT